MKRPLRLTRLGGNFELRTRHLMAISTTIWWWTGKRRVCELYRDMARYANPR